MIQACLTVGFLTPRAELPLPHYQRPSLLPFTGGGNKKLLTQCPLVSFFSIPLTLKTYQPGLLIPRLHRLPIPVSLALLPPGNSETTLRNAVVPSSRASSDACSLDTPGALTTAVFLPPHRSLCSGGFSSVSASRSSGGVSKAQS